MGFMTLIMAVLGVAFGSILYESNAHKNWMSCYSKTSGSTATTYTINQSTIPWTVETSSETVPPSHKSCWLVLVKFPGDLWISALKLLIIPLMSTLMLTLPSKMRDIAPVGFRLLALLLFTSFMAGLQGLLWGNAFKPGDGVDDP